MTRDELLTAYAAGERDFVGANLTRAILTWANLSGANLSEATLRGANLTGATLRGADLYKADLTEASLREADLYKADLSGATLRGADLTGASLTGADLPDTVLDHFGYVSDYHDEIFTDNGLEIRGAYIYGWRTAESQFVGNTTYTPGEVYTAPFFSICQETDCHPGLYFAGQAWLEKNYSGKPIVRCKALRSRIVYAGGKFRTDRLWILEGEDELA
jgi:hypothetical protein